MSVLSVWSGFSLYLLYYPLSLFTYLLLSNTTTLCLFILLFYFSYSILSFPFYLTYQLSAFLLYLACLLFAFLLILCLLYYYLLFYLSCHSLWVYFITTHHIHIQTSHFNSAQNFTIHTSQIVQITLS